MRVKASEILSNNDKDKVNKMPLVYVGNSKNYISVYRSGDNSDPRRLKVDVSGKTEALNIGNLFQDTDKSGYGTNSWVNISLSYDSKENKIMIDLSAKANGGTHFDYTFTGDFKDADIIIGGDVVNSKDLPYSGVQMTTFCVFNKALSSSEIAKLNENKNISSYTTMNDIGGLTAYYDFDAGSLENEADGGKSLKFIEQAKDKTFSHTEITGDIELEPTYNDDALNLSQTAKNGGILLDVVPTDKNNFSISFSVTNSQQKGDEKPTHEAELVYMGSLDKSKYYNIYRSQNETVPKSGGSQHIRIAENSKTGNKASGSNAFNQGAWSTVTFTVNNGTVKAYVNGEANDGSGGSTQTFDTLSESDFAIILGGLKDEYDGKDILIKDLYIYDTALTEEQVKALSTNENPHIALSDDGKVIGKYPEEMEKATKKQRAGWYFVNSSSNLTDFYGTELGTAKEFCGLPANEVIKNEIDLSKLPVTDSVLGNIRKATGSDVYDDGTDVDVFRSSPKPLGSGYIATSGDDFTGSGYLWKEANNGSTVTVDQKGTAGSDYTAAITMPEGVTRQDVKDGYSPCVFFIDDWGYLRCFYNNGSSSYHGGKYDKELRSGVSYVYKKNDNTNIKSEDLQYALGQFAAKLHNATPNSMISAVRFSNQNVATGYEKGTPNVDIEGVTKNYDENVLKKLVMLDWTSDTKEISQILSLERGDGGTNATDPSDPSGKEGLIEGAEALEQYNYGMTGGTYTWTGFQAYMDFLDARIDATDKAKKYIILFTDGMDNMLDGGDDNEQNYAVNLANALKEKGYTIFCVVLKNKSFETSGRAGKVQEYMAKIAGTSKSGDVYDDLFGTYIFEADNVEGLTSAFTGEILRQVSSNLLDYTVKDYIDPRFDLVDGTGSTIVLGKDGKVTGGTLDTSLPKGYSNGEADVEPKGTIHNIDGEEAVLCYNKTEDRYYLEWVNQDIPGTTPGQNSLTIWSRTFRVKAKEDFIGGNAVLSNGKKAEENWVFNPGDTSSSSGITDAKVNKENIDSDGNLIDPYVSKGFPRTTVNVRLLTPLISENNDEIYMGEVIDPKAVAEDIIQIVKSDCYWEYLKRYYSNDPLSELSSKKTTYANALEAAIKDLIANKSSFDINKYGSADGDLKKYLDTKGITLSADNSVHSLTVPYLYLPNEGGTNTVGKDKYLKDRVGEITYMIVQYEPEDKDELSSSTNIATTDAQKRKYLLWVQFTAGNEKTRETANSTFVEDSDYKRDSDYKPAAGKEQTEKHT